MINKKDVLKQLNNIYKRYQKARKLAKNDKLEGVSTSEQYAILTAMSAAIDRLAPPGSRYIQNTQKVSEKYGPSYNITAIYGIFKALRDDYRSGYLQEIEELIHADVFSDFLDMAEYLLNKGFKDPAAVLIGGVLEEHLKQLCQKNSIPVKVEERPKKADIINSELSGANIYSKLDQKNITAWLDLRNKAAHGKYDEYTKDQVKLMLLGVRDFVSRLPA